jgi:hypothetical protein
VTFLFLLGCVGDTEETGGLDTADTAGGTDSGDTGTVADENFPFGDHTLDFGITLDPAAIDALADDPATRVHATFTYGDESWDAGLHLKGSRSFRGLDEKASFKIDFHEWDPAERFHGLKRLTLNNMIQDSTMSSEHASYELHARMGNVAPRHGYARVTVNGEWFGLYSVVEGVDDDFLERAFPDDDEGNLYEGGYGGDFQEGCARLFEQKEGTDTSLADLEAMIDAVEASTPETVPALLEEHFDVESLLDMWAVELISSNDDAYTTLGNNYFAYHAPSGKWTLIPWGTDQAFQGDEALFSKIGGALAERCVASSCEADLIDRIEATLEVYEQTDFSGWLDAETTRIENDCRTDPRSEWGDYGCRDALIELRAWVAARPGVVRAELGSN